jgi:hypothetical protein
MAKLFNMLQSAVWQGFNLTRLSRIVHSGESDSIHAILTHPNAAACLINWQCASLPVRIIYTESAFQWECMCSISNCQSHIALNCIYWWSYILKMLFINSESLSVQGETPSILCCPLQVEVCSAELIHSSCLLQVPDVEYACRIIMIYGFSFVVDS